MITYKLKKLLNIIRHYSYENNGRITTTVGRKSKGDLRALPLKNARSHRDRKKRGRKGLYTVFAKGTIGYATIDPYWDKIKIKKVFSSSVVAVLNATLILFALMSIQNNLAEYIKSFLHAVLRLTESKNIKSVERRIRAALKYLEFLYEIEIERIVRGEFIIGHLSIKLTKKLKYIFYNNY